MVNKLLSGIAAGAVALSAGQALAEETGEIRFSDGEKGRIPVKQENSWSLEGRAGAGLFRKELERDAVIYRDLPHLNVRRENINMTEDLSAGELGIGLTYGDDWRLLIAADYRFDGTEFSESGTQIGRWDYECSHDTVPVDVRLKCDVSNTFIPSIGVRKKLGKSGKGRVDLAVGAPWNKVDCDARAEYDLKFSRIVETESSSKEGFGFGVYLGVRYHPNDRLGVAIKGIYEENRRLDLETLGAVLEAAFVF